MQEVYKDGTFGNPRVANTEEIEKTMLAMEKQQSEIQKINLNKIKEKQIDHIDIFPKSQFRKRTTLYNKSFNRRRI